MVPRAGLEPARA